MSVTFSDHSTGNPLGWDWNFGDGGTSTVQHPNHTYTVPGTFTVTLAVTNVIGSHAVSIPGCTTAAPWYKVYLPAVVR